MILLLCLSLIINAGDCSCLESSALVSKCSWVSRLAVRFLFTSLNLVSQQTRRATAMWTYTKGKESNRWFTSVHSMLCRTCYITNQQHIEVLFVPWTKTLAQTTPLGLVAVLLDNKSYNKQLYGTSGCCRLVAGLWLSTHLLVVHCCRLLNSAASWIKTSWRGKKLQFSDRQLQTSHRVAQNFIFPRNSTKMGDFSTKFCMHFFDKKKTFRWDKIQRGRTLPPTGSYPPRSRCYCLDFLYILPYSMLYNKCTIDQI